MSTIDQQFVEFIVKSLVGNPDSVSINRTIDEKGVLLELTVSPDDLGRVIGKHGATAQSIRTLLRALGTKNEARYNLKIVDNGVQGDRPRRDDSQGQTNDAPVADNSGYSVKADDTSSASVDDGSDSSSVISKARQELADLDDLDL